MLLRSCLIATLYRYNRIDPKFSLCIATVLVQMQFVQDEQARTSSLGVAVNWLSKCREYATDAAMFVDSFASLVRWTTQEKGLSHSRFRVCDSIRPLLARIGPGSEICAPGMSEVLRTL